MEKTSKTPCKSDKKFGEINALVIAEILFCGSNSPFSEKIELILGFEVKEKAMHVLGGQGPREAQNFSGGGSCYMRRT